MLMRARVCGCYDICASDAVDWKCDVCESASDCIVVGVFKKWDKNHKNHYIHMYLLAMCSRVLGQMIASGMEC